MDLGAQDYRYYTESDGDKKAAAAGAAAGGSLGAWHGLNKSIGKEYEQYKKGSKLYKQTADHNINLTKQRIRKSKIGPSKKYRNRFAKLAKRSAKLADEQMAKSDYYASPGRIKDSINKVGKKKVLKSVAKYGAPAAVATGVAAYGLHKLYKHKNESVEDENMNTIALYETEYDGVYATEDGYLVDEDGNLYDGNGDLIQEDAITLEVGGELVPVAQAGAKAAPSKLAKVAAFAKNHKKAALGVGAATAAAYGAKKVYDHFKGKKAKNESFDLYETEMPGIYVTEDGYFVDTDGSLYDQDGDLIEEDAVVLERGNLERTKGMAKATAAGAAGAGLGYVANKTRVVGKAINIAKKHPYVSGSSAGRLARVIKKSGPRGAAIGAGVGLAAYGAKKAYDHFKGKNKAKCESTVTDYDGLA